MRIVRACWVLAMLTGFASGPAACTKQTPTQAEEAEKTEAEAAPTELDLWAGVPALEAQPDDIAAELTPRPEPLPPPTERETIALPFDAIEDAAADPPKPATVGPLKVERHGPTGAQGTVDAIRLSFDQPMVPLADLATLDEVPSLVTLDPAVPGTTKWLGTRTLVFVPDEGRLPYSTDYRITVPAGVKSTWEQSLAKDFEWTVSTPALELTSSSPWNGAEQTSLEPTITLEFNQPIERTALVAALSLRSKGGTMALKIAPKKKGASPDTTPEWKAKRRVTLVPERPLAPDTRYTLTLPPGVYGEGPKRSGAISTSFSTYPPLRFSQGKCYDTCWANEGIRLVSSNPVQDPDIASKIHVEPEPPGFGVYASYSSVQLAGDFEGKTRYRVTVDAGVRDVHGQTLAREFSTTVRLGPPYPSVALPNATRDPIVIESGVGKNVDLRVGGISTLDVRARSLGLDEVPRFLRAYPSGDERQWPTGLAAPSFTKKIATPDAMRRVTTVPLDLAEMLSGDTGHLWLLARSNPVSLHGWTQRQALHRLVEVTDLGIATAIDRDSVIAMVTQLSTGEPVADAAIKLIDRDGKKTLWEGTTDAEGFARFDVDRTPGDLHITASTDDDSALLPLSRADLRQRWRGYMGDTKDQPRAFFFADRKPHKPGDTVHLAGIVRREIRQPTGGVDYWRQEFTATYEVTSPRGQKVAEGEVRIGKLGTFAFDVETKEDHGTGNFNVRLEVGNLFGNNDRFFHSFPVETYRAPEFTVAVDRTDSKPLVFGDTLVATIKGEYLHGAPLVGGQVQHSISRSATGFSPPGSLNDGFSFGTGRAHYGGHYGYFGRGEWAPSVASAVVASGDGSLDNLGAITVSHTLHAVEPKDPDDPTTPAAPAPTGAAESTAPPPATTFTVAATVTDENRQAIAASSSFVVHAARQYVGLRSERTVLREGERAHLEAVAVDLEGERVAGRPITLSLVRRETTRKAVEKDGHWRFESTTEEREAGRCDLTSGNVPVSCDLDVAKAGTYVVRGDAEDADGNATRSELTLYVRGKDAVVWENTDRRVDLVPDRKEYRPGDTATVLLRSPFDTARGIVVVEREGVAAEFPVVITGGAATVEIPIEESMLPAVTVSALLTRGRVEVEGAPDGQDLGMPAAATGEVRVPVSVDSKKIAVELAPRQKELSPGETMTLDLHTTTSDGSAAPAAVAVMVVDEGVLSLMGHQTPDPLAFFHHERSRDVWMYALQASVLARDPAALAAATATAEGNIEADKDRGLGTIGFGGGGSTGSGYGRGGLDDTMPSSAVPMAAPAEVMDEAEEAKDAEKSVERKSGKAKRADNARTRGPGGGEAAQLSVARAMAQPVSLREVFATTAFFDGEILTDASGRATVEIEMPENLTTFRVMAVAVDTATADRFGSADTTVRVRKPVMLRPSLPRFANYGDRFEASVMVDNQTGEDQAMLVGTRGLNVKIAGDDQKLVQIPAGESKEVRFDMETQQVGTMRLQFAAMSNGGRDATELSLPVHYPATAEAFADYGMIDGATQMTVVPPADALPAFGGLEVSMSSTALSGLEDAVDYLVTYPYECAEQTASRVLPIFALSDILDDFPIAGLSDRVYRDHLAGQGLRRLKSKQSYDGGFGYWKSDESWPYLTNWVTFALLEGKRAGFAVDEDVLRRALDYVENFVRHGHRTRWGVYYDWTSRAMGLWLLSGEKRGAALFDRVWAHRKDMPLYARALLMTAAHRYGKTSARDQVLDELRDAVIESPKAAHFAESTSEADAAGLRVLMHSNVQTDAIALLALLEVAPKDSLVPKVMAGLMASRDPARSGRWGTTHANAWALVAADRYYEVVEAETPDFTARVWLDDTLRGAHEFAGRSMATTEQQLGMASLQGADERSLVLGKEGPGKLYYRVGLRYAPKDLVMPARDQGFVAYRSYEALPAPGEEADESAVQQLDDGSWQVKAGTNVKVTLTVVARDRARYVVVDDALPAGFEGQNPRFVTSVAARSESTRTSSPSRWWWPWWSFDHTDLRDDRMLLFADTMPAGVYTYSYTARATSIGTFSLPPIRAEAMYEPERFGHSESSTVRVVE